MKEHHMRTYEGEYALNFGETGVRVGLPIKIIRDTLELSRGDKLHVSFENGVFLISRKKLPKTVKLTGLPEDFND